jgi:5-methylcytosine-specific restriction endonuclease McrA
MRDKVAPALRALVRERARHRCEYCLIHEEDTLFPHELDHIVARKHRGGNRDENLAWACFACNAFKGSDIASIDIEIGQIVPLFNPRKDQWSRHFRLAGGHIIPRTSKGRVTEYLLQFNLPKLVKARQLLMQRGRYPR